MNNVIKFPTPFLGKNKLFLLFILALFFRCGIMDTYGQDVISSNGSSYKSSSVQLDYTIGEPVVETYSSTTNALTQGFQQSNLTVTAIDMIASNEFFIKVYPNPVLDILNIEKEGNDQQPITLKLFDISGKFLMQKEMGQYEGTLDMQVLRPGNYLLRIYSNAGVPFQSFKILKK